MDSLVLAIVYWPCHDKKDLLKRLKQLLKVTWVRATSRTLIKRPGEQGRGGGELRGRWKLLFRHGAQIQPESTNRIRLEATNTRRLKNPGALNRAGKPIGGKVLISPAGARQSSV